MDVVLDKPDPENPPGLLQLTKNEVVDWQPSWSPDGTKIAFSSKRDGNWEIYVMDANGQNQVNLTNNPAKDITATWLSQTLTVNQQPHGVRLKWKRFSRNNRLKSLISYKLYHTRSI